ncbi:hypothetical protein [Mycoplasma crocodyli]|uniref:Bacteriocin n=1 Tax=Mycoplasma crocodyli (strain ATCC 51981 / MP145) TaxID=512564 RepID=D5E615_MYCCM|nr:hypothetical protein [Mycoplasma crocodyli]ADE20017.1 hypothetical protein MCRO_0591 [Mycoplasma crocodyli MP145]
MKINQLTKLNNDEMDKIEVGALISTLMSALPLIFGIINPVVGLFKTATAAKAEIKLGTTSYKWENKSNLTTNSDSIFLNF